MAANRLLESLPPDLRSRLMGDLETTILVRGDFLMEPERPLQSIYFPTTAMISIVVGFNDGSMIEAAVVGNDGFVGITALFGVTIDNTRAMVQIEGEALHMPVSAFWRHLDNERLRQALGLYALSAMSRTAQSAGCMAFHPLEQRLARWLLEVQHATQRDEFPLTQDFMSIMLGVHRPTVTVAVRMLHNAGLIDHRRGVIKIVDPEGLQQASCECYSALRGFNGGQ
jgi:CRP-like cAMP-binding protein